jgi:hypothetical protein
VSETTVEQSSGQYESKAESDKTREDFVARWLAEIDLASKLEEGWRKEAEKARNIYRAEKDGEHRRFNILFSNVQTEVPALYNSTPTPDVRTRYDDEQDISRIAGQAVERMLSFAVDQYDFDGEIKAAVQDRQLAGRGLVRVRYVPYEYQGHTYQEVTCELVSWKHFRIGPTVRWEDRPWIAFEHFLTRDQLMTLSPEKGGGIQLDFAVDGDGDKSKADAAPNVFKRARIWEIWDKTTRKVYWIAPSYKPAPIRSDDDPYGLIGFFPCPEPMYAIKTSDSMVPVCPYRIIAPLVEELEETTKRIQALVKVLRWRGFRNPALPGWEALSEAEDGELIAPADGSEIMALVQSGGLDKHIFLMPIDQAIKVLQQLYVQREQIKQTIFEVSGLSDILRGQSDPSETLGAQEIKANFGSMRLQDSQKDVQRFCRDLFRIKAEIGCNMFDSETLKMMTGLQLPSRQDVQGAQQQLQMQQAMAQQQAQMPPAMGHNGGPPMPPQTPPPDPELVEMAQATSWEDVLEVLKTGIMRAYRIDIETDSTVLGDVRQKQQSASLFLQGTAQFIEAVGPAVQAGMMPGDVAVDLFAGFARLFKLGKQAEDALARMSSKAAEAAKNPPPPQPSPEEIKAKAEAEKMAMQSKQAQEKHQLEVEGQKSKQAHEVQMGQIKIAQKEREFDLDAWIDQSKAEASMQMERQKMSLQNEAMHREAELAERQGQRDEQSDMRHAALAEFMATQKAKREMEKPRPKYDA